MDFEFLSPLVLTYAGIEKCNLAEMILRHLLQCHTRETEIIDPSLQQFTLY